MADAKVLQVAREIQQTGSGTRYWGGYRSEFASPAKLGLTVDAVELTDPGFVAKLRDSAHTSGLACMPSRVTPSIRSWRCRASNTLC
ncbi:MAG: hypothetical protein WDO74_31735 [Pseudomonadota bacterium]